MKRSVLICDDSRLARKMIVDNLPESDWTICGEAESGRQAVELFQQLRPDIVTMDLVMKGQDGLTTVREIREIDPQAKCVIVSSVSTPEMVAAGMESGASDFLCKPLHGDELCRVLEICLNDHKAGII